VVPGWSASSAGDPGQWEAVELSYGTSAALVPDVGPLVRETSPDPDASVTRPVQTAPSEPGPTRSPGAPELRTLMERS